MENDVLLFKEIKKGNEAAFKKVYDEFYTPLCYFASKFINDFDKSRSLVQEVFVDLWIKREDLNIHYSIKSYIFNSVRNSCVDYLRKKKSNDDALERIAQNSKEEFHDYIEEAELNERINNAILSLPEKCREIFILCKFDEMKYSGIAEKLGISVKTVEMQMGIAFKKLRAKLSDYQWINLMILVLSKKTSNLLQGK